MDGKLAQETKETLDENMDPSVEEQKELYKNNTSSGNVIEIFNTFKKVEHISDYQIKGKKGNWKIISSDETSSIEESIVDVKNGYISLTDGYTGGGSISYQFVLFRSLDNKSIIGITKSSFDGSSVSDTHSFWEKINSEWIEVTNKVLPKFNYTNFFKNSNQKEIKFFADDFKFKIELPQFGTISKLSSYIPSYVKNEFCSDPDNKKEVCQKAKKAVKDIYSLELKWDKTKKKFYLGRMIKK